MLSRFFNWLLCRNQGPKVYGRLMFVRTVEVKRQEVTVSLPTFDPTDVKQRLGTVTVNPVEGEVRIVSEVIAADAKELVFLADHGDVAEVKVDHFDKAGNKTTVIGSTTVSDTTAPTVIGDLVFAVKEVDVADPVPEPVQ